MTTMIVGGVQHSLNGLPHLRAARPDHVEGKAVPTKLTVIVPEELSRRAKARAALEGTPLTEVVC